MLQAMSDWPARARELTVLARRFAAHSAVMIALDADGDSVAMHVDDGPVDVWELRGQRRFQALVQVISGRPMGLVGDLDEQAPETELARELSGWLDRSAPRGGALIIGQPGSWYMTLSLPEVTVAAFTDQDVCALAHQQALGGLHSGG